MRRSCKLLLLGVALPLLAAAAAEKAPADKLQELQQQARAAKPQDATLANMKVVRQEVELAEQYYKNGDMEKGRAAVEEAVHYAQLAGAAVEKHSKHLKKSEIILREAVRRLSEIRRTLEFDDQGPVQKAQDEMEAIHQTLLTQMFEFEK